MRNLVVGMGLLLVVGLLGCEGGGPPPDWMRSGDGGAGGEIEPGENESKDKNRNGSENENEEEEEETTGVLPGGAGRACAEDVKDGMEFAYQFPSHDFGFRWVESPKHLDLPATFRVLEVAKARLRLGVDDEAVATFTWPEDLPFEIPAGTEVQLLFDDATEILESPRGTLLMHKGRGFGLSLPPGPPDVLPTRWEVACTIPAPEEEICGVEPLPGRFLSVVVGEEPDLVVVPSGHWAIAGAWRVVNVVAFHLPAPEAGDCIIESASATFVYAHREAD